MSIHTKNISHFKITLITIYRNFYILCPSSPTIFCKCFCHLSCTHYITIFSIFFIQCIIYHPTNIARAICSSIIILVPFSIRIITTTWIFISFIIILITISVISILILIEVYPRLWNTNSCSLQT